MNKMQALHKFYNSFGLNAYPQNSVPNDVVFPYMVYENSLASRGNETNPRVVLWYHTEAEKPINDKAEEITKAIGQGYSIPCDEGSIQIYCSSYWQPLSDSVDDSIKGRTTNLTVAFNTY